jgi:hypothetical protein
MGDWDKQDKLANDLVVKNGLWFIKKVPRAGLTWSSVISAIKNRKKVLMIEPTVKICSDELGKIYRTISPKFPLIKMVHFPSARASI